MASMTGERLSRSSLVLVVFLLIFITFAHPSSEASQSHASRSSWRRDGRRAGAARAAILSVSSREQQDEIQDILKTIEDGRAPRTHRSLKDVFISLLELSGNLRKDKKLRIDNLILHILKHEDIFNSTLPFLASVARHLNLLLPSGLPHLTREHPVVHLKRLQVFALLAASFFGIIPHDQARLLGGSVNMNRLDFFYRGLFDRKPKLLALFAYFKRMKSTLRGCWQQMLHSEFFFWNTKCSQLCPCEVVTVNGREKGISSADELISFYLHTPTHSSFRLPGGREVNRAVVSVADIVQSDRPLTPLQVDLEGDILRCDGELQVDFADKFVGGLSVFADQVAQEELIFAVRPELLTMMLFVPALKDDEAVVVKGAESFVHYTGYESTFEVSRPSLSKVPAGSHWSLHGRTPLDPLGRRETTLVVIDALELGSNTESQYFGSQLKREILKAALGFQGDPYEELSSGERAAVATGKRGCTISGGDNELKTLLQWIAASYAGRRLHYNAFGDMRLMRMQETVAQIRRKFPTIKILYQAIKMCISRKRAAPEQTWSLWESLLRLEAACK